MASMMSPPANPTLPILARALAQTNERLNQARLDGEIGCRTISQQQVEIDRLRTENESLRATQFSLHLELQNAMSKVQVLHQLNDMRRQLCQNHPPHCFDDTALPRARENPQEHFSADADSGAGTGVNGAKCGP